MKTWWVILGYALALGSAAVPVRAEIITLNDGTKYDGTIEHRTSVGLDLRITNGPFTTIRHFDLRDIYDITPSAAPAPSATASPSDTSAEPSPAIANPSSSSPDARPVLSMTGPDGKTVSVAPDVSSPSNLGNAADAPLAHTPPPRPAVQGLFLQQLAASAIGRGPDDPDTLPADLRAAWNDAIQADKLDSHDELLARLRTVETAFAAAPGGTGRLDAVTRRIKHEPFGLWLAETHFAAVTVARSRNSLDFGPVSDVERPYLRGLLKEQTVTATKPLQQFFPPRNRDTGRFKAFKPAQLQGLTITNCIKVRDEAMWASALLLAQFKIDPDLPGADRVVLAEQLSVINHILSRCNQLVPLARRAARQADRQQHAPSHTRQPQFVHPR